MLWRLVGRRLIQLLISLFAVITLTFFLMKAIPGNPFLQEQAIPQEILDAMMHHYGFDKPIFVQYLTYLKKVVTFSLGPSFKFEGWSVNQIIYDGFPISLCLGVCALSLSITFGILLGTLSALYRGKWQDHFFMVLAVLGISTPSFILATLLQYLFAMKLSILPIARWGGISHLVLPVISLSALPTAFIARLVKTNMIETLEQDYITMAKAKGLSTIKIVWHHVLKNSILPVLSYIGHISASIMTGSFVIEKIFGIPGLGSWFVGSIINRDYTVIMGITVFYSSFLMLCIFIVDILYMLIDPRINRSVKSLHG
ncbi:MAG: ABC transporter permease [Rhabdochlamydiaceae bacterium]|nr:ABC transporter permease [Candidatus Amphrikana amoebophyrae]